MSIESKAKSAVEAALQNIIDNEGEVEIQKGDFRTKNNSAGDVAKLIAEAHKAGIDLTTATSRTIATRVG